RSADELQADGERVADLNVSGWVGPDVVEYDGVGDRIADVGRRCINRLAQGQVRARDDDGNVCRIAEGRKRNAGGDTRVIDRRLVGDNRLIGGAGVDLHLE